MNVQLINPFIESFKYVMGHIGFSETKIGQLSVKPKQLNCSGVMLIVGVVGDVKGNIVYVIDRENAKKIASAMMMGMPVEELDDMSKSSLSELSNMLSANAATGFSKSGLLIDISTPTFLEGEDIAFTMSSDKVLCVELLADGMSVEVNLAFDKYLKLTGQ